MTPLVPLVTRGVNERGKRAPLLCARPYKGAHAHERGQPQNRAGNRAVVCRTNANNPKTKGQNHESKERYRR